MKRRGGWLVAAAVSIAALVVGNCQVREERGPEPTPAPPFSGQGTLDQAQVLAYARTLHYDTEHGAGETRRLMVGCPPGQCRYGPLVRIDPEEGAVSLSRDQLAQGRVLVRMISLDTMPYPKLGLGARPDTAYWFVRDSAGLRSWYVSSDRKRTIVGPDTFKLTEYPHGKPWRRTIARFVFRETDEGLWIPCIVYYCCQTTDPGTIQ
jgi:hypothetical protein